MWLKHYKLNEHEQKLVDMSAKEFDDYMMSNYPDMFISRYRQEGQNVILPMNFGFEMGEGWRHILDKLCKQAQVLQKAFNFTLVFDQIKEKFGSGRFYCHIEVPEGVEISDEQKIASDIAQLLASHYEEYTEYICEVLGTNVNPEDKVRSGVWMFGCGLEGFKKSHADSPDRIESAEKHIAKNNRIKELKDELYRLPNEDLDKIKLIIDTRKELLKNK